MKFTPSAGSCSSVRIASVQSLGSPHIPGPAIRIAPNPRRLISISPPILKVPASLGFGILMEFSEGQGIDQESVLHAAPASKAKRKHKPTSSFHRVRMSACKLGRYHVERNANALLIHVHGVRGMEK